MHFWNQLIKQEKNETRRSHPTCFVTYLNYTEFGVSPKFTALVKSTGGGFFQDGTPKRVKTSEIVGCNLVIPQVHCIGQTEGKQAVVRE